MVSLSVLPSFERRASASRNLWVSCPWCIETRLRRSSAICRCMVVGVRVFANGGLEVGLVGYRRWWLVGWGGEEFMRDKYRESLHRCAEAIQGLRWRYKWQQGGWNTLNERFKDLRTAGAYKCLVIRSGLIDGFRTELFNKLSVNFSERCHFWFEDTSGKGEWIWLIMSAKIVKRTVAWRCRKWSRIRTRMPSMNCMYDKDLKWGKKNVKM